MDHYQHLEVRGCTRLYQLNIVIPTVEIGDHGSLRLTYLPTIIKQPDGVQSGFRIGAPPAHHLHHYLFLSLGTCAPSRAVGGEGGQTWETGGKG